LAKLKGLPQHDAIMALADVRGRVTVKVTPNAGREAILMPDCDDTSRSLQLRVTATPEDGKANDAVLKLLSKALRVPRSSLSIVQGETSRMKLVQIRQ
jgi:uncharacterized protein